VQRVEVIWNLAGVLLGWQGTTVWWQSIFLTAVWSAKVDGGGEHRPWV